MACQSRGLERRLFPGAEKRRRRAHKSGVRVGVDPSSTISRLCDWGISLRLVGLMRAPAKAGCENLMEKAPTQQVP